MSSSVCSLRALRGAIALSLLAAWGCAGDTSGDGSGDGSGQHGTQSTGSSSPTTTTTSSGTSGGAAQTCVDAINTYRATLSLPAYARWSDAEACADGEAQSDSQTGAAHGAFGACAESAQNECPGWPGPPESMITGCLDMMWAEGPGEPFEAHGHYINMSSTQYSKVACGFSTLPDGSVWAVQDFQ